MSILYSLLSLYLILSLSAVLVNYRNISKGLGGIPYKDCLNPAKWFSVGYGFLLKFVIPPHVLEQYVLRFYEPDCQVCLRNGKCVGGTKCGKDCACGCDTLAKMYSPFETDSGENWGKIIFNETLYKQHRREYPIEIKVNYGPAA